MSKGSSPTYSSVRTAISSGQECPENKVRRDMQGQASILLLWLLVCHSTDPHPGKQLKAPQGLLFKLSSVRCQVNWGPTLENIHMYSEEKYPIKQVINTAHLQLTDLLSSCYRPFKLFSQKSTEWQTFHENFGSALRLSVLHVPDQMGMGCHCCPRC